MAQRETEAWEGGGIRHSYGTVGTSGLGRRMLRRSPAAPDANRRGTRPLPASTTPHQRTRPGERTSQSRALRQTKKRDSAKRENEASPPPYFLPFGAQSFMPGMAPPATSQRYRLATEPYGA